MQIISPIAAENSKKTPTNIIKRSTSSLSYTTSTNTPPETILAQPGNDDLDFECIENDVSDTKIPLENSKLNTEESNSTIHCVPERTTRPTDSTVPGLADLFEFREKLQLITRHNLINHSALVRKAAIHLLEFVAMHTMADLGPFFESQVS